MYIFSGQDCQTVNVDLKNEVLNKYEYLQGDYQISTAINEKASWKNGAYAIWSIIPSSITKIIGPLNRIGEASSWISTTDDKSLTNIFNRWNFWNGSSFIHPSEPKAIQITCNGKYYRHLFQA